MDTVHFTIHRKAAFVCALWPYRIYINGQLAGSLRSRRTLHAEVPAAKAYFIDDDVLSESNAIVYDDGQREKQLLLKTVGGWRTDAGIAFYTDGKQLPSFRFERFYDAIFQDGQDGLEHLTPEEETFALCLKFDCMVRNDLGEVLASGDLPEMANALQRIKAHQYADFLRGLIRDGFCGAALPLNDDQLEEMYKEIEAADKAFFRNKGAREEFHNAVVAYIMTKLTRAAET